MRQRRLPNNRNNRAAARDSFLSRRAFLKWGSLTAAGLALGPSPMTTQAAGASLDPSARPVALIANTLSNTLTVADAHTLEPVDTIKVGREPHKFRESLTGRSVYSCNVSRTR